MYPKIRQQFIEDLQVLSKQYQESEPFPHIVLDNFFTEEILDKVLSNFPNLEGKNKKSTIQFNAEAGIKSTSKGEALFNGISKDFMYFLNSETFLLWLQELTGIKEKLISDLNTLNLFHQKLKKLFQIVFRLKMRKFMFFDLRLIVTYA